MKLIPILSAIALFAIVPASISFAGTPMSKDDCSAWLVKADTNKDGGLGGDEAAPYLKQITQTLTKPKDAGTISGEMFMEACTGGMLEAPAP